MRSKYDLDNFEGLSPWGEQVLTHSDDFDTVAAMLKSSRDPKALLNQTVSEHEEYVGHFLHEHRYQIGDSLARSYDEGYSLENATLLHVAAAEGDQALLSFLLAQPETDLNPRCTVIRNRHMLLRDCLYSHDDMLTLDDDDDADSVDSYGIPYEDTRAAYHREVAEYARVGMRFINCAWFRAEGYVPIYAVDGVTPLHLAAFLGDVDCVERLLRAGADPMIPDSTGSLPHHYLLDALDKQSEGWPGYTMDLSERGIKRLQDLFRHILKYAHPSPSTHLFLGESDFSFTRGFLSRFFSFPVWHNEYSLRNICRFVIYLLRIENSYKKS